MLELEELEEDGAAGAGSAELPSFEDYGDGDPASRERFGPAEREETVTRARQVTLRVGTGTPPAPPSYNQPSWSHHNGVQGPRGCFGALRPQPGSRPLLLTAVFCRSPA